jgi:hypothetical protein
VRARVRVCVRVCVCVVLRIAPPPCNDDSHEGILPLHFRQMKMSRAAQQAPLSAPSPRFLAGTKCPDVATLHDAAEVLKRAPALSTRALAAARSTSCIFRALVSPPCDFLTRSIVWLLWENPRKNGSTLLGDEALL